MTWTGPDDGIGRISEPRTVEGVRGRLVELVIPGTAGALIPFVPEWNPIGPRGSDRLRELFARVR